MVLVSVVTTTDREGHWVTRDVGRYFPQAWMRFREGVPEADRDGDLIAGYARLLHDPDRAVREKAAEDWCRWEDAHVAVHPDSKPNTRYEDPRFRMAFARIVTHYWHHAAWLENGSLLRDVGRLAGIPAVLIHGRIDLSSPIDTPGSLGSAGPVASWSLLTTRVTALPNQEWPRRSWPPPTASPDRDARTPTRSR